MNRCTGETSARLVFDLGFVDGAEAAEAPSVVEFSSRVREYQLGFIVGRSLSEAVRQTRHGAMLETAGLLGARFHIDFRELLAALKVSDEQADEIHRAYERFEQRQS